MNIIKFLKEWFTLFAGFAVFFLSPIVLRWIDPTAGIYDVGVLQVIIVAIVMFCVFQAFVWGMIKLIWPGIFEYIHSFFNEDFKTLEKWQKIKLSLCVYFCLFLLVVVVSRII